MVELGLHHVPHRSEEVDEEQHNDKLFNTAYYIDRGGKVIGRYTKRVRRSMVVERDALSKLTLYFSIRRNSGTPRRPRSLMAMTCCMSLPALLRLRQSEAASYELDCGSV